MIPMIAGSRIRRRQLGMVAEFCDRCLCITRHGVVANCESAYLYFVPLASVELRRECICEICNNTSLHPRPYCGIVTARMAAKVPIEQLIRRTNPQLISQVDTLLEFVDRFDSADDRRDYVAFQFLSAQERFISTELEKKAMWAMAIALIPLAICAFLVLIGKLLAAITVALLIPLAPLLGMLALRRYLSQRVFRRVRTLISGSAMDWQQLQKTVERDTDRFANIRRIFAFASFRKLDQIGQQRAAEKTGPKHYICLTHLSE